jgi:hypothetical protein
VEIKTTHQYINGDYIIHIWINPHWVWLYIYFSKWSKHSFHQLSYWNFYQPFSIVKHNLDHLLCHNPSLGLAIKAGACKGASQEWSPGVPFHAPRNVGECERMNPHTPNWAPILGVGVATLLWKSVRMRLTLPKWGLGSPPGLPKFQSLIARVKTPRIGAFFILLESYQSLDVENGLTWAIWIFTAQVMARIKVGSQIGSLTPDH